jgi:hypothetical protein
MARLSKQKGFPLDFGDMPLIAIGYILLAIVFDRSAAPLLAGTGRTFIPLSFLRAPHNGKASSPLRRSGMGTGASTPFV